MFTGFIWFHMKVSSREVWQRVEEEKQGAYTNSTIIFCVLMVLVLEAFVLISHIDDTNLQSAKKPLNFQKVFLNDLIKVKNGVSGLIRFTKWSASNSGANV